MTPPALDTVARPDWAAIRSASSRPEVALTTSVTSMTFELLTGVSHPNPGSRMMWMVMPTRVETWHGLSLVITTSGPVTTPHGSATLPVPEVVVVDPVAGDVTPVVDGAVLP